MQVIGSVLVGRRIKLTGVFTPAGQTQSVDPDGVSVRIRKPDATFTVLSYGSNVEIQRTGAGVYEMLYVLDEVGRWWFGFEGYGGVAVIAVEEVSVLVRRRVTVAA